MTTDAAEPVIEISDNDETNRNGADDVNSAAQSDPTDDSTMPEEWNGTFNGTAYTFIRRNPNGFQLGLELDRILFAMEDLDSLCFVVKWKDTNNLELVPASDAKQYAAQEVIAFYEERLSFVPHASNNDVQQNSD